MTISHLQRKCKKSKCRLLAAVLMVSHAVRQISFSAQNESLALLQSREKLHRTARLAFNADNSKQRRENAPSALAMK